MNEILKEVNGEVLYAAVTHTIAAPITTKIVFVIVSKSYP
jgi:hypothetical protein